MLHVQGNRTENNMFEVMKTINEDVKKKSERRKLRKSLR